MAIITIIMVRILNLHNRAAINPEIIIIILRFQVDKFQRIILQAASNNQVMVKDNNGRRLTSGET